MEVLIAGGHGKIALRLTRLLQERGDAVRSLIRNPDHADGVRQAGGEPVVCDLEAVSDELPGVIGSVDAIVFAAGAGPGSGPQRKETVDYGGVVKTIAAAHANGIRRYVIVSSMGADPAAEGGEMAVYQRAKGRADAALRDSGLDYTIVAPGRLSDEPGTGLVTVGKGVGPGEVSRDDVAAVIVAVLHDRAAIGKGFDLIAGDVPVQQAVAGL